MSNIYITEPPTQGKVVLHTSFGDVDIEFWPKECPKAVRNFIQLAMEGYYNNTIFHRLIRDFMMQGGDPTGTGTGGESVYGKDFEDETHQRIKFNHRGQIAMANLNQRNTNKSQFFITLGACEWLNGKHTIFGKVTGQTIFNVLTINGADTDKDDRPLTPIILRSIEILANPFPDIVPRRKLTDKTLAGAVAQAARPPPQKKNLALLSFDDEMLTVVDTAPAGAMKSLHDVVDDGRVLKQPAYEDTPAPSSGAAKKRRVESGDTPAPAPVESQDTKAADADAAKAIAAGNPVEVDAFAERLKQQLLQKARAAASTTTVSEAAAKLAAAAQAAYEHYAGALAAHTARVCHRANAEAEKKQKIAADLAEYRALQDSIRQSARSSAVSVTDLGKQRKEEAERSLLTPLQQQRAQFTSKKRQHGAREADVLKQLEAFKSRVRNEIQAAAADSKEADQAASKPTYTGQVLYNDDEDDSGWLRGRLRFVKHFEDDLRTGDNTVKIDPLADQHKRLLKHRRRDEGDD